MKMKKCIPATIFLLNLVNYFKFLFKKALTRLGLLKPPPEEEFYSPGSFDGYVLVMDSRSRSLVPVSVQLMTAIIRKSLRVVEYGNFMERFGEEDHEQVQINGVCTVCLESLATKDEIRELCNCSHVFHKECLDTWVDEGQVTCPLCRSTLYSDRIDWTARESSSSI